MYEPVLMAMHSLLYRLDSAYAPACRYVSQFPSHSMALSARFVAFIVGSFTALLLLVRSCSWPLALYKVLGVDSLKTKPSFTALVGR